MVLLLYYCSSYSCAGLPCLFQYIFPQNHLGESVNPDIGAGTPPEKPPMPVITGDPVSMLECKGEPPPKLLLSPSPAVTIPGPPTKLERLERRPPLVPDEFDAVELARRCLLMLLGSTSATLANRANTESTAQQQSSTSRASQKRGTLAVYHRNYAYNILRISICSQPIRFVSDKYAMGISYKVRCQSYSITNHVRTHLRSTSALYIPEYYLGTRQKLEKLPSH